MKISDKEKELAGYCIRTAVELGASAARASLSKSVSDSYATLEGALDKVTHSADRSIFLHLFVDGRYGTYSTNMLDEQQLRLFVSQAVESTRLLAPDECRRLPARELCADDALTGEEMGLYDPAYMDMNADDRLAIALSAHVPESGEDYSVVSLECEYSDNIDDNYIIDSQGFEGRHTETSFSVVSEITIADKEGRRYSGFWWDSSWCKGKLFSPGANPIDTCTSIALERARAQMNPGQTRGGKRKMVVDRNVASRLVAPLFGALYGSSIQQKNSFLIDALGKKTFADGLTIIDMARATGKAGARLFDTEGVATENRAIIENGVVKTNFIDTYISGKMGVGQTIEGPSVPVLQPYPCNILGNEINLQRILKACGNGILVTGFNGGNCNAATGNFSYGVEGFTFSRGKIVKPVRELVITGNMIELWNQLIYAGNDPRQCSRWQIPTLAFKDVTFSA
ncbi:MAG: TldD/PmbA family protein [Bacteroidales bacterium]|nr:TldD/PmbA family protein [Candidatus Cryptobacteroides caccocaballi]